MANEQGGASQGFGVTRAQAARQSGSRRMKRGAAAVISSGMSPTMQAAYMQSANEMGDIAANALSDQFWKKQFENVIKFEVQEHVDYVKQALEARNQALQISVMPVGQTVEYEEGQEIADATAPQPDNVQTVPTASQGPEGQQGQEAVPQRVHSPNPAGANAGEMGATRYSDQLALLDPALGNKPVPLGSGRGMAIMQLEDNKFLQAQTEGYRKILDIAAKYPFNPYANKFIERTYQIIEDLSNEGLSGSKDPKAAQLWKEGREQFEAEQDTRQQALETGQIEIDKEQARLKAQAGLGQNMLNNNVPGIEAAFGETIVNKMRTGEELTPNEQRQVSAGIAEVQKNAQLQITMDKATGQYRTPIRFSQSGGDLQGTPTEWALHDDGYQLKFGQAIATQGIEIQKSFANLPMEDQKARLLAANRNITAPEMDRYERGSGAGEQIELAFELIAAQDEGSVQRANDTATLLRAPELAKHDKTLNATYDAAIDQIATDMESRGFTEKEIAYARARRWKTIYESPDMLGRPLTEDTYDVDTKNRLDAWAAEWGWTGDYPNMGRPGFMGASTRAPAAGQQPPSASVAVPGTDKPAASEPLSVLGPKPPPAGKLTTPASPPPEGNSTKTVEWLEKAGIEPTLKGVNKRLEAIAARRSVLHDERKSEENRERARSRTRGQHPWDVKVYTSKAKLEEDRAAILSNPPLEVKAAREARGAEKQALIAEQSKLEGVKKTMQDVQQREEIMEKLTGILKRHPLYTPTLRDLLIEFSEKYDYPREAVESVAKQLGIK
ncbi:MAG TPA: hypothetical protein VM537_24560 [Anaerolineae bacterium]|nr:hypothetical protein [Anaerolineae bacterium]